MARNDRLLAVAMICSVAVLTGTSLGARADVETWSGNDLNDSNWTSNNNWSGIGGAAAGDALVFPASADRKTNVNNFPVDTPFVSLAFNGGGYSISGSRVLLTGDPAITGNIASGSFVFGPSIKLGQHADISNNGASPYTLGGTILLDGNNLDFTGTGNIVVNGVISGSGRTVAKSGTGTVTINSNSGGFGTTAVSAGELRINGTLGDISAWSGGTLSGTGTFGNLAQLGTTPRTIAPGSGANTTGILTAGAVVLGNPVTLEINLNGTVPGTQYDQLATTSINLGNASLSVSLGFTPATGAQFTIVTGSRIGQFAQGNSITANGRTFTITYNANSVVLTAQPPTRTWTGAVSDLWNVAGNWAGNVLPTPGENLLFPQSAIRKTTNNNFPAGTAFGSITVTGNTYTITGQPIALNGGIAENGPFGIVNKLQLPITLSQAQTFAATGTGLQLEGPIDLNGFPLTVDGNSGTTIPGQIVGAGGLTKNGTESLILEGNNTYTGVTQVNQGSVEVRHNNGLGATGAGNHTVVASGATLGLVNSVNVGEALTLNGSGKSNGGAVRQTGCSPACTLSGSVTLASDTSIGGSSSGGLAMTGVVGESGGARSLIASNVPLTLGGINTYTGTTQIDGADLNVTGKVANVSFTIFGGTLRGTGLVGAISPPPPAGNNGRISPGLSPGILNATGPVTFNATSRFVVELGGTASGTQYDVLNVTGSVDLGGSFLEGELINGFVPASGNTFTIIQSTGPITGQFAQGTSITFSGVTFGIAYNANSVVLTASPAAPLPDLVVAKTHTGNFALGQTGATYTATVTNSGAGSKPAGALVTLTDTAPSGLTITGMSGTGWTCNVPSCTRSDALAGFQGYPPVTIAVSVAANATSPQVNSVSVTTAATESSTANNSAIDSTIVGAMLTVMKSGSGTGTVASQDGGINCGPTCASAFASGSPVTLVATPAAGSVFTGWLAPCTGTANCVVAMGGTAITVSATFALAPTGSSNVLDIDANAGFDALTDGLMAIRYLFGLTGPALTANATGTGATRTDPAAVLAYLNDVRPKLDADGNGIVDALTDGLLILRDLFGLTGNGLIQNAIGPGATRTTDTAVQGYLTTLKQ